MLIWEIKNTDGVKYNCVLPNKGPIMTSLELALYNMIVILKKLCVFVVLNCNDAHTLISLRSLPINFAPWGIPQEHKFITKHTTNNRILERRLQLYWLQDYNTCRKTTCQKNVLRSVIPPEFLPAKNDFKMPNQQTSHLHKFLPPYILLRNYMQLFKHPTPTFRNRILLGTVGNSERHSQE